MKVTTAVVFAALTLLSAGRAGSQSMSPHYRGAVQEYNNSVTHYNHIRDMYTKSLRDCQSEMRARRRAGEGPACIQFRINAVPTLRTAAERVDRATETLRRTLR